MVDCECHLLDWSGGPLTIKYIKKTRGLINQYLKFYIFNFRKLIKFIKENNIEIVSAKDPVSAFLPILIKKYFIK